jgi:hypothetical protein
MPEPVRGGVNWMGAVAVFAGYAPVVAMMMLAQTLLGGLLPARFAAAMIGGAIGGVVAASLGKNDPMQHAGAVSVVMLALSFGGAVLSWGSAPMWQQLGFILCSAAPILAAKVWITARGEPQA